MGREGQVVMITGAAGNLGRAVAAGFAADGAALVLLDVDGAALAAAYLGEQPRRLIRPTDLLQPDEVMRTTEAAIAAFGRIDVLCNIAGGFAMGPPVHETPPELWRRMLDVNATTIINTARAVVPGMIERGAGRIVNVGAMGGLAGKPNMGAYSASKSAVIRLTEAMAGELRTRGINVNCVLPSTVDTPQNRADMPKADPARWVAPEALADVVRFLASDGARAIHGAAIPVVGLS